MQTSSKTSFLLLLWVHLQLLPELTAEATALQIQVWAISWIRTKGYSSRSRGKHRPGNLAGGVWFCNAANPHDVHPSVSCLCHTAQWAQVLADVCPWAIRVTAFFPGFLLELTLSFFCLKITQNFSSPWKLCAEASPLKSMETQQSPFRVIREVRGRFCEQLLPASLTKGIKFTLFLDKTPPWYEAVCLQKAGHDVSLDAEGLQGGCSAHVTTYEYTWGLLSALWALRELKCLLLSKGLDMNSYCNRNVSAARINRIHKIVWSYLFIYLFLSLIDHVKLTFSSVSLARLNNSWDMTKILLKERRSQFEMNRENLQNLGKILQWKQQHSDMAWHCQESPHQHQAREPAHPASHREGLYIARI